jgi:hypothetical protein
VHRGTTGGDGVNALTPYRRSDVRRGRSNLLQFAADGVVADVRVDRVDRRNRCSWYAIQLASGGSELTARLVGVGRGGRLDDLGAVGVAPHSVGRGHFAVTTPRTGPYQAMYLELRALDVLLRIEAPRPPGARRMPGLKAGAAVVALGVAACCAGAVPSAFAPDASSTARVVAGATSRPIAAPQAVSIPRVLSFAAQRDVTPGGETVLASYLAVGERGTVALLDAAGKVVTWAPFVHVGTNRLRVPRAYRTVPMTAQITVHRGAMRAVASIVMPPSAVALPPPVVAVSAAPEPVTRVDAPPAPDAGGLIDVVGRALAGQPLQLRLMAQASPMHVELQDEAGATIVETDVVPGATRAVLPLPAATDRATYLLALHYTRNGGEETVIRTVVAAAR